MTRLAFLDFDRTLFAEDSFMWVLSDDPFRQERIRSVMASKKLNETHTEYTRRFLRKMGVLRGLSTKVITNKCDTEELPFSPDAHLLVSGLQEMGFRVIVLSGGIEEVVKKAQEALGFDAYFATQCLQYENGEYLTGEVVGSCITRDSKGDMVRQLCAAAGCSLRDCVAVGDGINDISMFRLVGFSVAFGKNCEERVQDEATTCVSSNCLQGVIEKIKEWNREQPRQWEEKRNY